MLDKLMQAQQKAEEIKRRLDDITVTGEAEAGKIKVTATGNKHITSIEIDSSFFESAGKEQLEELLAVAVNKAIEQAENTSQSEMHAATRDMFGGLGNIFG
jgi:DNA-binding YbaB/EbfC family protein